MVCVFTYAYMAEKIAAGACIYVCIYAYITSIYVSTYITKALAEKIAAGMVWPRLVGSLNL